MAYRTFPAAALLLALFTGASAVAQERSTQNVLLVTLDGLRWQELFSGADRSLLNREHGGVRDVAALEKRFWRDDPIERRKLLLPFFWSVIATEGQVFGDPASLAPARSTNGFYFSYPGYNEILSGSADSSIDSNEKKPNRNITVLEALHREEGFAGKIAAFASWDVFPFILNEARSEIFVNAGWEPLQYASSQERRRDLNDLALELPHYWDNVRYDLFTFEGALGYLQKIKPRVLYVAFGETDDWAHDGRYDLYLDAARRTDDYIRRLWSAAQAMPEYAGKTSIILTSDHGRGSGLEDWRSHGAEVPGADRIWIAMAGPDIAATGVQKSVAVTQGQVAASLAALLGFDWRATNPEAAAPLPGIPAIRMGR